jgi:hypothetical protein
MLGSRVLRPNYDLILLAIIVARIRVIRVRVVALFVSSGVSVAITAKRFRAISVTKHVVVTSIADFAGRFVNMTIPANWLRTVGITAYCIDFFAIAIFTCGRID